MNFFAPFGLVLGALALPLIGMYFLKIRRRRVQVPSLLLWEQFAKNEQLASPFQKFRRHLLLLLQLLLLLLIVLAFARPYLNGQFDGGRAVVIVMDTSASMAATDESKNRLDAAKVRAISTVENASPGDEILVVEAGAQTRVVAPFSRDIPELRAVIQNLEVREAEGSLREGIQLALSLVGARPNVEIAVFSDGGQDAFKGLELGHIPLNMYIVGMESENSGIMAIDVRSSPASDLDRQLFVTTQNFGDSTQLATLQVYLNEKLIANRELTLESGKPVPIVFELPSAKKGVIRAELRTETDYLPTDNTAYAVLEPVQKRKLLVVDGDALTLRALGADPRFEVTISKSAHLTASHLEAFDAILFMKSVPLDPTGLNYATFRPGTKGPVTFGSTNRQPKITQWQRTHPTQRFVQWDGVLVAQSKAITNSGGLSPIVNSQTGPLILGGTVQGGRVVQLAFDPWRSDLPLRVAWPVLVLNIAGWLTAGDGANEDLLSVKSGQAIVRRVSSEATKEAFRVKGPAGVLAVEVGDRLLRVQDTSRVGFYEIKGDGRSDRIAVNLSSVVESEIRPRRAFAIEDGAAATRAASVAGRYELWRWLLLLGLCFLVAEWWVWHRRRFI